MRKICLQGDYILSTECPQGPTTVYKETRREVMKVIRKPSKIKDVVDRETKGCQMGDELITPNRPMAGKTGDRGLFSHSSFYCHEILHWSP